MKMGHYGVKLNEGSAEDKWTMMDNSQGSWSVSMHTARDGWPVGGEASVIDETTCGSLTGWKLQSRDMEGTRSDIVELLSLLSNVTRAWDYVSALVEG